jgi:ceramide glucosyltransferase
VTPLLLLVALLMLGEKIWRHVMVVRFFRRSSPPLPSDRCPRVSLLQPILSGDPWLPVCLEANLRLRSRCPIEYVWLVDTDDPEGERICRDLIARYPDRDVRLALLPPAPDRCSPKMVKLIAGIEQARGEVLCVLDDDTVLPDEGLECCLAHLERPGVGLAFGLPYYASFDNAWSSLVACFVNSHSLLTYVPYTCLIEPFTINGMFFATRREVLETVGGLRGLESHLMDDFAIAQRFRAHGYRLAQTPLRHAIRTHVTGPDHYLSLLQRWLIFPRETVMKALPLRDLIVVYGFGIAASLFPLLLAVYLLLWPSWPGALYGATYFAYSFAVFAHFNVAYLQRATPWRRSWGVPLIQILLPLQLLIALLLPQRVVWRGHLIQIEPGGGFHFVRRRSG